MNRILTCKCGHSQVISPSKAGQEVRCDGCGEMLKVPTLRGLRELPPAETTPTMTPVESVWRTWRGPTMAFLVALFLITGGMSIRFLMQRLSIDTSYTAENEIELGNELFDSYGPDALSMTWEDYQTYGIGPKQRPPFYVWREIAWQRTVLASVTGAISLLCLLGAIGTWWSARVAIHKQIRA